MKKLVLSFALLMMMVLGVSAQSVEKRYSTGNGKITITSAMNLFSNCDMRMCAYTQNGTGNTTFGIELDLTDRMDYASRGDIMTITFKDGSNIQLENLYDTKADVTRESHIEEHPEYHTHFITTYNPWFNVIRSVPVTHRYTQFVPVTTTTSYANLFYKVTPAQLDKIMNGDIAKIQIVTDNGTITKKARPFSEAVSTLFPLVMPSSIQAMN